MARRLLVLHTPTNDGGPIDTFRTPVKQIHQIEITSRCNLACVYCTSPVLGRPKVDMSEAHFRAALDWWIYLRDQYGMPTELNLCGIGESTLHPQFVDFVRLARETVGPDVRLIIASNGLALTEEICAAVQPYGLAIGLSLHDPARATKGLNAARKYGLLAMVSVDPALHSIDWAGQIDWPVTAESGGCPWIVGGAVMVMADGRMTSCCLDASGIGVVGSVEQSPGALFTGPYLLCRKCSHKVVSSDAPADFRQERAGR